MKKRIIKGDVPWLFGLQAKVLGLFLLFSVPFVSISAKAKLSPEESAATDGSKQMLVKGRIVDSNGDPVIGASVAVKGSSAGTITDVNGDFSLNSPENTQLVVTYIGFDRQYITPKAGEKMNVVLKENTKALDEVVVVGYGTQRIKDVTGSIVPVDMKKIQELPVSNLAESLTGQIPGLSISGGSTRAGTAATASIRQSFSWSADAGNSVPLIVIDDVVQVDPSTGLATMDQFNMLDPSEIESITVLRDGAAAIYGSRASQGAIIVKTKRGKEGAPKISYSGKFEMKDAVSHTKTLNAYQYGVFANSFLYNMGFTTAANQYSADELESMKSLHYNWLKEAWKSAFTYQHSLNVSGGSKTATYFAGATYYNQEGNLSGQNYDRWTFRTGTDVNIAKGLKLSASVSGNNSTQEKSFTKVVGSLNDGSYGSKTGGEQADYGYLVHMPQYIPWSQDIDGTSYYVSPALGPHKVSTAVNTANYIGAWNYFALLNSGSKTESDAFNYTANFNLQYDVPFIKGLSLKASYNKSRDAENDQTFAMPYQLVLAKYTNTEDNHLYTSTMFDTSSNYTIATNSKNTRVVYSDEISSSEQSNFYITYDRKWGQHKLSAMGAVEKATAHYMKKYFMYDDFTEDTYNGESSSIGGTLDESNSYVTQAATGALSYLGRVSYSYKDRYLVQFLFRTDASTKFAPENYWGFFPNLSLGWVASEEDWYKKHINWMDYFKVRLSIGKTGKDNIKSGAWHQTYTSGSTDAMVFGTTSGGTLSTGLTMDATPNYDVHWDNDLKYNLGLDMNFLKNRLTVSSDTYFDHMTDMLISTASASDVAISIGGAFAEQNYGAIDCFGTNLSLKWQDKVGQVHYNVGVVVSFDGNIVRKYPETANTYPSDNNVEVGHSTNMPTWGFKVWRGNEGKDGVLRTSDDLDGYWSYLTALATAAGTTPSYLGITSESGMSLGMLAYQDQHGSVNSDGKTFQAQNGQIISGEDYAKLTKVNTSKGFTTNLGLNWHGIYWSAQVSTSWGGYRSIDNIKQSTSSNLMLWSHESYLKDMYDATNNVTGKYPNLAYYTYTAYTSDFWQVPTLRCYVKSMSLSYAVPQKYTQKAGISDASFGLTGYNLWDFYNPFPDHYRNMYDNSYASYPTMRTWALSVNLSF